MARGAPWPCAVAICSGTVVGCSLAAGASGPTSARSACGPRSANLARAPVSQKHLNRGIPEEQHPHTTHHCHHTTHHTPHTTHHTPHNMFSKCELRQAPTDTSSRKKGGNPAESGEEEGQTCNEALADSEIANYESGARPRPQMRRCPHNRTPRPRALAPARLLAPIGRCTRPETGGSVAWPFGHW